MKKRIFIAFAAVLAASLSACTLFKVDVGGKGKDGTGKGEVKTLKKEQKKQGKEIKELKEGQEEQEEKVEEQQKQIEKLQPEAK